LFKRPFKKVRSRETSKSWVFAVTNNKAKNRAIACFFYAYTCFLFLSFAGTVCKTALSLSTYPSGRVFAVTNNKAKNRAIAWFFYVYTCFLFLSFAGTVCKTALSLSTYPSGRGIEKGQKKEPLSEFNKALLKARHFKK
jgi:succinate-acetate transporter protein